MDLELSQVRLINNSDFPWVILVPRREDIIEITDLEEDDYTKLMEEIRIVAGGVQEEFTPDKLNIATLGNVVSQMHFHIIARYQNDELYPKPVWGCKFTNYGDMQMQKRIRSLKNTIATRALREDGEIATNSEK